ncbi:MAG TPA: hypothetical protein VLF68_00265 [Candidatus Saccharimonadales bacterium]|nr:hypothetical protein [Candidatus Saccharimonadales bacterium]
MKHFASSGYSRFVLLIVVVLIIFILIPVVLYISQKTKSSTLVPASQTAKSVAPTALIPLLVNPTVVTWNVTVQGKVTATQDGAITISQNNGTFSFLTDSTTQFFNRSNLAAGQPASPSAFTSSSVKTGDTIQAFISVSKTTTTYVATEITLFPNAPPTPAPAKTSTNAANKNP